MHLAGLFGTLATDVSRSTVDPNSQVNQVFVSGPSRKTSQRHNLVSFISRRRSAVDDF